jgi:hypothetical protein
MLTDPSTEKHRRMAADYRDLRAEAIAKGWLDLFDRLAARCRGRYQQVDELTGPQCSWIREMRRRELLKR